MKMDDVKNALEKFRKELPDLSRQMDNALKYLDMLKRDRLLAQLANRAQRFGDKQMEIASDSAHPQAALDQQKQLAKDMEDLLSDIKRHGGDEDKAAINPEGLPALQPSQDQMREMHNAMKAGRAPPRRSMERMAGNMFSLADNLRDLQSSAMMRKMEKERDALLDMAHDALSMADWEKELEQNRLQSASPLRPPRRSRQ